MRLLHIHIAEDQPRLAQMLRDHLELVPDFRVTGVAGNGRVLLDQLAALPSLPDVVLMDIQMPVLDGIGATEALKAQHPQVKVVMATVFDDEENIFNAILAGADGYLLKDEAPEVLHRALQEVMSGGAPMSPAIARKSLAMLRRTPVQPQQTDPATELSERELEILEQLSKGLRYDQVAANLNISTGTVRKHIENIYRKLQVHNKTAAVEAGKKRGWI
ncbi:MAG TPA: response regulator transcription factor [Saprospiraceae bacterium]|nr:response regulator transcription factor [Saprospiraceae bacterium]HRJ13973.1 response regulator transcription factor [Saprospiraceae bacterium]HRK79972.1 response regulator transcription factor [Saprospiraceae bacterium]